MREARRARLDMGFGLEGPLPDLLEAVEGSGGAHVVVLDLGDDVAGACLQRGRPRAAVRQRRRMRRCASGSRSRTSSATAASAMRASSTGPADVFGAQHDPAEVAANYFAAEFLMPGAGGPALGARATAPLDELVRLAAEYGVSAKTARIRLETCGALRDRALAARLDAEIDDEGLHLGLAGWFGWQDLRDALSARRARRACPPPCATARSAACSRAT